jgi:hypothetical protein
MRSNTSYAQGHAETILDERNRPNILVSHKAREKLPPSEVTWVLVGMHQEGGTPASHRGT